MSLQPVRYAVDLSDRVHHLLRVTVHVPADAARQVRMALANWTPGSYFLRNYVHHVQWLRATGGDGAPVDIERDGANAWLMTNTGHGLTVELELYANELTVRTNHVDDHHALIIPAATFPFVTGLESRQHEVTIDAYPQSHRVWSLLPPGQEPGTFVADDLYHLIDSAFEVGELDSVTFTVDEMPHEFVWAGHAPTPDLTLIADNATAIAGRASEVFGGDLPVDRYTVLCTAWDRGGGGLEHRDGAVIQVPVTTFGDPDQTRRFYRLFAHEYFHLWNVKRLVPRELLAPDLERTTHSPSLWVAEGWTAYYDGLLPARAGVTDASWLLTQFGDVLDRVASTPGAQLQSLRQASHDAWTKFYVRDENSSNASADYYGQGAMVAWELDLRLRADYGVERGLDDVIASLWQHFGQSGVGYTETDILEAIASHADDKLAALIDERVGTPSLPMITDELLAAIGLRYVGEDQHQVPDLGVEMVEDDDGVVFSSALRQGPAWEAGITGGDRLVAINATTVRRGELAKLLQAYQPGAVVELTVTRGPRIITAAVRLGEPRLRRRIVAVDNPTATQHTAFARWCGGSLDQLPR
ncbi:MAG: PDZ domain-containing protein [Nitriliruptoraceae bacterium]